MKTLLSMSLAACLVAGCVTLGNEHAAVASCEEANRPETGFLGLHKPPGAEFAYQDYAEQTYLYSQMSDNAYDRTSPWHLPERFREVDAVDDKDGTGFAAKIFEEGPQEAPTRIIVSFRGTEGSLLVSRDWWNGNFRMKQQRQAENYYQLWRAKYPDSVPFVTTGHSLGGALALQISINYVGVPAYVFNSSYRVRQRGIEAENQRLSIAETWDVANLVRYGLPNPTILHLRGFDCTEGSPITNHGMTALARCLTRIAAAREDAAVESLRANQASCSLHTSTSRSSSK